MEKLFKKLLNLFRIKKEWKPKNIWEKWNHNGWGNNIGWGLSGFKAGSEIQEIAGHFRGLEENDELRVKMESGGIARLRIFDLRYMTDPTDQFFAKAKFIRYKGD